MGGGTHHGGRAVARAGGTVGGGARGGGRPTPTPHGDGRVGRGRRPARRRRRGHRAGLGPARPRRSARRGARPCRPDPADVRAGRRERARTLITRAPLRRVPAGGPPGPGGRVPLPAVGRPGTGGRFGRTLAGGAAARGPRPLARGAVVRPERRVGGPHARGLAAPAPGRRRRLGPRRTAARRPRRRHRPVDRPPRRVPARRTPRRGPDAGPARDRPQRRGPRLLRRRPQTPRRGTGHGHRPCPPSAPPVDPARPPLRVVPTPGTGPGVTSARATGGPAADRAARPTPYGNKGIHRPRHRTRPPRRDPGLGRGRIRRRGHLGGVGHGWRRQDRPRRALGSKGRKRLPRRAVVREPAGVRPPGIGGAADRGGTRLPRRARSTAGTRAARA